MLARCPHTYPSLYPPGASWAFDEAWAILDALAPGMLDHETRAYVAGMIAGTLTRVVSVAREEQAQPRREEQGNV